MSSSPVPRLHLTRDAIAAGAIQSVAGAIPGLTPLSEAELDRSQAAALALRPDQGDLWLFAYGSLLWNPAFSFEEQRIGHLLGWHRRLCLWSKFARGTPKAPGLVFGLERGGSCRGLVYRLPAAALTELQIIWRREMVSGAYQARWVRVATEVGPRTALTFTINRRHTGYTGPLSVETVLRAVRTGEGAVGPCLDYVRATADALTALGIPDRNLTRLMATIDYSVTAAALGTDAAAPSRVTAMPPVDIPATPPERV